MHRGCFVWTPTPPLSGRRTPRPGPVRVWVRVLFLAGSGGPASRARSGAPHLLLWPPLVRFWFVWPPPGWGRPVCGCCCFFLFSFFFFFFFLFSRSALVVYGFPCFPARGAFGLARSGPPTAPPPPPFLCLPFLFFLLLFFPLCGLVAPFGCSLVVPVLCVLLPVVWRCRGVFCVSPGAVWRACVGLGACRVLLPPVAVA